MMKKEKNKENSFILKNTVLEDLPSVALCHRSAFSKSLASAFGKRFVTDMLAWYLSTNKTFIFHFEGISGSCLGYCGGLISDGTLGTGSASGMGQFSFRSGVKAFLLRPWLLFHPEIRVKIPLLWKNLLMKLGLHPKIHLTQEQKLARQKDPHVGLVVIGVDPKYQGNGYGSLLLKEFERRAVKDYGIRKLQLSVLADNAQAIRAYERNGWKKAKLQGKSLSMIKTIIDS